MYKKLSTTMAWLIKNATKPETIAGVVITITVIAVTINTSAVIMQNYTLERDVRIAEQMVAIAQAELDTQKLKNEYYKTDAFIELAVRKQLSKGLEGEKLIIVPKSVAQSYIPKTTSQQKPTTRAETPKSNFAKWVDFIQGDLE